MYKVGLCSIKTARGNGTVYVLFPESLFTRNAQKRSGTFVAITIIEKLRIFLNKCTKSIGGIRSMGQVMEGDSIKGNHVVVYDGEHKQFMLFFKEQYSRCSLEFTK